MKISCVIPVYNEAKRVSAVLDAVLGNELVDEIIVVNDGSTDDSFSVLRKFSGKNGIKLISYEKNKGKTHALKVGFLSAKNPFVMTIDSDLVGLRNDDITALISPVLNGLSKTSMTVRKNSAFIYKLFGLDFISGERVFEKSIIEDFSALDKLPGFGFEVFLNKIFVEKKLSIKSVKWANVITPRKRSKSGFISGTLKDFKMVAEIFSTVGFSGVVRQFISMLRLKV